ncbi:hypothetical protein CRYUN_Cryun28dG0096300 [Craigia yunnanensis]
MRAWALEVHVLWKKLSRKVSSTVHDHPKLHTLLPLLGPVMIPSSRFREVYYWDSYWVIKGSLASKMYKAAKAIVTNLISLLDAYGHVQKGARAYYASRSQLSLLSAMVYKIYIQTSDVELVRKYISPLLKEYQFWNSEIHTGIIRDAEQGNHSFNRYYAMWKKPRLETSTVDREFASKFLNVSEKQLFYRELASAAESRWDFSTRWMGNSFEFTTLSITTILPVDLNIFILMMELDIALLAKVVGANTIAEDFLKAFQTRQKAFNSVFWNENMGQ